MVCRDGELSCSSLLVLLTCPALRPVLQDHQQLDLQLHLPDLQVREVKDLLEGLYERRQEVRVGKTLYNLLMLKPGETAVKQDFTEDAVKEEPKVFLDESGEEDAEGFADAFDPASEGEFEGVDVTEFKMEEKEVKPKPGKRRGRPRKKSVSESKSSGEEWEEFYEKAPKKNKVKAKRSSVFPFKKLDNSEDEPSSPIRGAPTLCSKCGRALKGHPMPRHVHCELEGRDEEGLLELQVLKATEKERRRKREKILRDERIADKGYSSGFVKLPCEKFACEVCEIDLTSEYSVLAHVRKNHGPKEQLQCMEDGCCGKVFKSRGALHYHKEKCHQEKAPCTVCGTTDYTTIKNHMANKHLKSTETHTCDQCGKEMTSKVGFKNHMAKFHGIGNYRRQSQKWPYWSKIFAKECHCQDPELKTNIAKIHHLKLFHLGYERCSKCKKIIQNLDDTRHKCAPPKKWVAEGPFICEECGQVFNSHGGRDYHIRTHHLKETEQCTVCGKTYPKQNMKCHMLIHNPKTPCNVCGKVVAKMREHMMTSHMDESEMAFRCDTCGRGFPNMSKLKDHNMNVHLKLRPYKCR